MKKMIAAVLAVGLATVANADVTFDPVTGQGFVGKGDVQTAFAWNNAQLQANANALTFVYGAGGVRVYEVHCEKTWTTGKEKKVHLIEKDFRVEVELNRTISYSPRVKNQVTGFNLEAYVENTTGGAPTECPPDEESGFVFESATLVSETLGGAPVLNVTFNGTTVALPIE